MNSRRDILKGAVALALGTGLTATLSTALVGFDLDQPKPGAAAKPATATPGPQVSGPVTGGKHGRPFASYLGDIAEIGYVEEEFFIEGEASAYEFIGEFPTDGRFNVQKATAQPYKTRLLVRRPADPAKFNGTVLVEWINVSAGFDIATCDPTGIYEGFAWVAVSAQRVGLHGYTAPANPDLPTDKGLCDWDPQRYSSLSIPGDSLSYDIFTQGARAVGPQRATKGSGAVDPLGGLQVRKMVAIGASQSGVRLVSYVNGVQPLENVFDAVMPMVFFGYSASWIDGDLFSAQASAGPVQSGSSPIRNDISTKVFGLNTEPEAAATLPVRQPDTESFRYWEIAGAGHGGTASGQRIDKILQRDGVGAQPAAPAASPPADPPAESTFRSNDVLWHPSCAAAIHQVHRWINGGEPPPMHPLIEFDTSVMPPQPKLDQYGNALGGVRLPELEVPIARYDGSTEASPLGGQMFPFTPEQLKSLYPTHEDYVAKVTAAAEKALQDGVILPYRVEEYVAQAKAAAIPG